MVCLSLFCWYPLKQDILNLAEVQFINFFPFVVWTFSVLYNMPLSNSRSLRYSPMFSLEFKLLHLGLWSDLNEFLHMIGCGWSPA